MFTYKPEQNNNMMYKTDAFISIKCSVHAEYFYINKSLAKRA